MRVSGTLLPKPEISLVQGPVSFDGRDAIERYLDQLNKASPGVDRRISSWGGDPVGHLCRGDVKARGPASESLFLVEALSTPGLEIVPQGPDQAPAYHAVFLPVAGAMSLTLAGRRVFANAGEGLIADLKTLERAQYACDTHRIEFLLSTAELTRLAAAWSPDTQSLVPRFSAHLGARMATSLAFMAGQIAMAAAETADSPDSPPNLLLPRWREMIALTLILGQRADMPTPGRRATANPTPASMRRAIEYMQAHADSAIDLADVALAACASIRSLLRHFNAHLGISPYAYLRNIRLDRARAELLAGAVVEIRDLALRWGYQSASKFAAAYQARFHELPSDTRRRSAG